MIREVTRSRDEGHLGNREEESTSGSYSGEKGKKERWGEAGREEGWKG